MSSTEVPTENEGSALQLLVLCNGIPLTDIVQVSRINISQILNRVSEAVIQIQSASCDQVFQRGSDISMYASWGNNPQQMIYFGKIQSYEMGITDNTGFAYILYCRQLLSDVEVVTPDLTRPPVLTLTCGDTMRSFTGRYYGTQSTSRTCTVSCAGTAVPVPGTMIELANVGKDFSGTALVTELSHIIAEGDWVSTLVTGDAVNYQTKFGKQKGLQMATVKKLTGDPEQKGRILVDIITGEEECFSVWAYYAGVYATGTCLFPEIGDDVLVDSLLNDADVFVVLGSLANEERYLYADTPDEDNYTKSFTTRSGIKIKMDDNEKVVTVQTPGQNSVVISDKDKSIVLKDQNANSIILSEEGITLSSSKNITLSVKGNILLDALDKTSIISKSDIILEGLNIIQTAQVGFIAKGNASAELSASGQTTVKGAIVMIN